MAHDFLRRLSLERWIGQPRMSLPILRVGFEGEWLTAEEVVQIELARYKSGLALDQLEEKLALLLSDEMSEVPRIIKSSADFLKTGCNPSMAWFYSAGMELLSIWHEIVSPGEELYAILEALELDERFNDLVYFAPVGIFAKKRSPDYLMHSLRNRLEELRPSMLT